MSDRSSAAHHAARAAAVAVSLSLFAFVIVNAQFGCDAPATNAPPQEAGGAQAEKAEKAEPKPEPKPEPAPVDDVAPPPAEPSTETPEATPEPVFMPASKSGGDFGSMRFPGEQAQQAPNQQAPNPAPQR